MGLKKLILAILFLFKLYLVQNRLQKLKAKMKQKFRFGKAFDRKRYQWYEFVNFPLTDFGKRMSVLGGGGERLHK